MTDQQSTSDESTLTDPDPVTGDHPGGPRHEEPPFPAIAEGVGEYLAEDSSGHDLHHVWRVFRLTQRLADEVAADVDREIVGAAALTHDLHRVLGDGTGCDPGETLEAVDAVLRDADVPASKIPAVQHCVAVHDEYAFRGEDPQPETVEAELLRDADNLDAMGAVGVARTFAFGGAHGTPLWDPDGQQYSQLYHLEDKLLKLPGEMHTEPGRELAADRREFLETFHERFRAEWHGDG